MYPTIYLIILLSVQETPKVLANQISVCVCLGRLMGTAEGRECLYPTGLCGILPAGTTYGPLLSSKHGHSPQARQYTPLSRRNTEIGAQLSHSPCCRGGLGLLGGIRLAAYAEVTCSGLVLHGCLCPCACTCAWKIPTPDFSITEPAARGDRFSLTERHFPFGSHTVSPQSTYVLLHTRCSFMHSRVSCPTW